MIFVYWMLFSGLAYWFYYEADELNDFEVRYDEVCKDVRGTGLPCELKFVPDVDLVNPKVYYRLDSFYSNHRSFQKYDFA